MEKDKEAIENIQCFATFITSIYLQVAFCFSSSLQSVWTTYNIFLMLGSFIIINEHL